MNEQNYRIIVKTTDADCQHLNFTDLMDGAATCDDCGLSMPGLADEPLSECESCGAPATRLIADCDPGGGYHGAVALCDHCRAGRLSCCGSCKAVAL